ncbi:Kinetoplast-associated protein kap [Coniochaeta hoffmannii]|uniref:Kinetoplast-associated protein kap n=1 Tax=Coniochaeta hoffmannii TaxID=91930 RepID=A0AA38VP88_9PEZI|nr:Kinetoplast-associated protein kap [Coniochaeta hoffmannii]
MASPLSPAQDNSLNSLDLSTPAAHRYDDYEVEKYTANSEHGSVDSDDETADTSSPFMSQVIKDDQENNPPPKLRPASRVLSGAELSPLKLLQLQERPKSMRSSLGSSEEGTTTATLNMPPPATMPRSPRKMSSPEKRFPVKVSTSTVVSPAEETPRASRTQSFDHKAEPTPKPEVKRISLEEVVRENEGLKHAIDIFEDEASVPDTADADATAIGDDDRDADLVRVDSNEHLEQHDYYDDEEAAGPDDTMVSTFSTFSAVPNLTMFAAMRPDSSNNNNNNNNTAASSKFFAAAGATPRVSNPRDLSPLRTPRANNNTTNGPLPNRAAAYESGNTTNLLDFTENLRLGAYQPQQPSSPRRNGNRGASPSRQVAAATPQRQSMNLLDFDIPPLPTPRSIPTITPRELESLKSGFLSEISSLKASLSGKEAESQSLKSAVGDAEKRVGECMERLREAKASAEALAAERESWERRGREMEAVLRKVKEEIVLGQRDREELEARLEESEKRRDAAETMAQEAESKMAGMRAGKASAEAAAALANGGTPVKSPRGGAAGSNREVEIQVEKMARELHAAYKSKHETKVAALKKSYENKWQKRVRELEGKIDELSRENEELRVGRDVTMTKVDPDALLRLREEMEGERKWGQETKARLEADVGRLEAELRVVKADNEEIRGLLERERVEKGELVQLAEEMMNMQSFVATEQRTEEREVTAPTSARGTPATVRKAAATPSKMRVPPSPSPVDGFRGSMNGGMGIARPSGLRAPAAGASRIGKVGAHGRTGSTVTSGVPRPGSGMGMRSGGLLSSIEKMGSYRGRAE